MNQSGRVGVIGGCFLSGVLAASLLGSCAGLFSVWGLMPAVPGSTVTYANFLKVADGMTEEQVVAILGDGYAVSVDSNLAGHRGRILTWHAGMGNCSVTFENGRAVMKGQASLPR